MKTTKHIDFHLHTYYSDGIGSPEDNVRLARFSDLDYMAITDHDKNETTRKYAIENNLLLTYGSDWHGGLFGRMILSSQGENVLSERLANALRIEDV